MGAAHVYAPICFPEFHYILQPAHLQELLQDLHLSSLLPCAESFLQETHHKGLYRVSCLQKWGGSHSTPGSKA